MTDNSTRLTLTGRISAAPAGVWHEEVLAPQFAYDVANLLPAYVAIEKVLLLEYRRMDLIEATAVTAIARELHRLRPVDLAPDPQGNLSDLAFAIEQRVLAALTVSAPAWHVDRSRNDLQSCAQLMHGRQRLIDVAEALLSFGRTAVRVAADTTELPMPGYTQLQPAQVVSPGFYLSAVAAEAIRGVGRLATTYQEIDHCPLGAGAIAGQELLWDRARMAELLGFRAEQPHALSAVASRTWTLSVAADLSSLGVTLSRFATDLMTWAGEAAYIELPDELSGISSAMPQKKNVPILERIRGRTAQVTAGYLDVALAQRNTPYTNMVEVSKESTGQLHRLASAMESTLRLFTAVLAAVRFRADRMRAACEREFLGALTLANRLTLDGGVPWRTAQVLAGAYVTAATAHGRRPEDVDAPLLADIAQRHGFRLPDAAGVLAGVFSAVDGLRTKRSAGSAHPDCVREMLEAQHAELDRADEEWARRRARLSDTAVAVDCELGLCADADGVR